MAGPESRPFDVGVLGVTGFTGRLVLKELVAQLSESPRSHGLSLPVRVAAGGRSPSKVQAQLAALGIPAAPAGSEGGIPRQAEGWAAEEGPVRVSVVEVDVMDEASVRAYAVSCRLLLNCVGPFRFYGRQVVSACVRSGTDYLDVSGEPEFMERMVAEFQDQAVSSGCLVVSACGFDSVPADLGLQATVRALAPDATPMDAARGAQANVSSYLTISAPLGVRGNYGTWDSLVHGMASVEELRQLRKKGAQKSGSSSARKSKASGPSGKGKGSGGQVSMLPKWSKSLNSYILPFPGADVSVVRRTLAVAKKEAAPAQALVAASTASAGAGLSGPGGGEIAVLKEPLLAAGVVKGEAGAEPGGDGTSPSKGALLPASSFESVRYSAFFTVKTAFQAWLFIAMGALLTLLVRFGWGRKLLLKYPEFFSYGLFSRQGPTREQLEATFFTMRFDAERVQGSDVSRRTLVVHGPEPGYVVTPWILVQCGLTVLRSRALLPKGGVLTPAVTFAGTDLQQRLEERGMRFEVIS